MSRTFIKDYKSGDEPTEFFALRKVELKTFDNGNFLRMELGDASGRIGAVLWNNAPEMYKELSSGDVVKVRGKVDSYRDSLQIKVDRIRKAEAGEFDPADFLPASPKDTDKLFKKLQIVIASVQNPWLKKLLDSFFGEEAFRTAYCSAVGGKLWHHAYIGGLVDHTLTVVGMCERAAEQYELVNRDLLVTGAILHDVGKIKEYDCTTFVDFSDEGRLRGHIVMGEEMVREKIKGIDGFPEELRQQVCHLILAHQGRLEFGSPVVPLMLESLILFYADELDSKANAFMHIINKNREEKPDKKWSDWVHLMERFIYVGKTISE